MSTALFARASDAATALTKARARRNMMKMCNKRLILRKIIRAEYQTRKRFTNELKGGDGDDSDGDDSDGDDSDGDDVCVNVVKGGDVVASIRGNAVNAPSSKKRHQRQIAALKQMTLTDRSDTAKNKR